MEEQAKATAPGSRRHSRWTMAAGVLLVLMILLGVYHLVLYQRVARLEARARAAGFPITAEELEAWYPEPEGENAAELVLEAGGLVVGLQPSAGSFQPGELGYGVPVIDRQVDWPALGAPLPAEMAARIEPLLKANRHVIERYRRAGAIGQARYPTDFAAGINMMLPQLGMLRDGARLLAVEAVYAAAEGDRERAEEALGALFGLARTLDYEPILISHLVKLSILGLGNGTLEEVAARCELSPEAWNELAEQAQQIARQQAVARAWAAERAGGWQIGETYLAATLRSVKWLGVIGVRQLDRAWWLRYFEIAISEVQSSPPEQLRHVADVLENRSMEVPRAYVISSLMLPAMAATLRTHIESHAAAQLLLAAAALEAYRAARSPDEPAYPDTLAALAPRYLKAVPVDPWDGQPIRYQRLEDGFLLYSVGRDGIDDGGTRLEEGGSSIDPGTDIVFTVRPPSLREPPEMEAEAVE